jgi:hypothetical protein
MAHSDEPGATWEEGNGGTATVVETPLLSSRSCPAPPRGGAAPPHDRAAVARRLRGHRDGAEQCRGELHLVDAHEPVVLHEAGRIVPCGAQGGGVIKEADNRVRVGLGGDLRMRFPAPTPSRPTEPGQPAVGASHPGRRRRSRPEDRPTDRRDPRASGSAGIPWAGGAGTRHPAVARRTGVRSGAGTTPYATTSHGVPAVRGVATGSLVAARPAPVGLATGPGDGPVGWRPGSVSRDCSSALARCCWRRPGSSSSPRPPPPAVTGTPDCPGVGSRSPPGPR